MGVGPVVAPRAPGGAASGLTSFHRRLAAEALRASAGAGPARLAPALAHAAVDLNPHQVEAAAFALGALPTGGAILADEVGLGKTIEAGLVLAQLAAEGRPRAVVLVPASLRAQWRAELREKLGLEATVVDGASTGPAARSGRRPNPFDTGGVVVCSHGFGARHAAELERVAWDLAVVDEAHRLRNAWRHDHRTGQALRRALRRCPKLLLTATPLQNDLMDLLGLASFVDETLLGTEASFRLAFAGGELTAEKVADLRGRLAPVVVRTLRRQVKEHVRFTARRSMVEDFAPSPEEQALYQRVSDYLRREDACAIPPARRALLVLVYRKILASSTFALAGTLERLAASLEGRLAAMPARRLPGPGAAGDGEAGAPGAEGGSGRAGEAGGRAGAALEDLAPDLDGFADEVEELDAEPEAERAAAGADGDAAAEARRMRDELAELRACARLARDIGRNAKGEALARGLDRCFTVARACGWPEKAVVFTEFRRTQEYLAGLLAARGWSVTCLSGEVSGAERRAALVEEFRDRTQVLLMTEAGAEGLNLQFCNLVVNFDLPWNPQRVEQRIGRCHRYGQRRDVLVLNFVNRANAADARLYELLAEKLALFDGVFGSSDEILGALGSGVDFERRVLDIYQACRSGAEVDEAFARLRGDLDGRISARFGAARALLFERFDGEVRARLRLAERAAREAVDRRRADEAALLAAAPAEEAPGGDAAPAGGSAAGRVRRAAERLLAAPKAAVSLLEVPSRALPARLARLAGREGWWFAYRLTFEALVPVERVAHLVLWCDGAAYHPLAAEEAADFAALPAAEVRDGPRGAGLALGGAQEEALAALQARLLGEARERSALAFDESRERWDRLVEDSLAAPRRAAEEARAAWVRARGALHEPGALPTAERRALLERAEREQRRRLDELRAAEARLHAERDRAVADLRRRAEPRVARALVASAWWRCT